MTKHNLHTRAAALICVLALTGPAHAGLLWTYSYTGGGADGSGYITTSGTTDASGGYDITGVSGYRNGTPIESLLAAGTYPASGGGVLLSDNALNPTAPYLNLGGFTVAVGSGLYNLYNTGGQSYDLAGSDCLATNCGQPGHLGTPVALSVTSVPELEWQFSYSGAGVTADGILTTLATPVGGDYQIVGLQGERNGMAMNALLPGGTWSASGGGLLISDNLLSPTDPFLDLYGFTFHSGNDRDNVYDDNGQYYELAGVDCLASNCGQPGHLGTPIKFSLTPISVPEPSTLPLLMAGLIAGATVLLRRRLSSVARNSARR